jgi:hypothetical protein
MVSVSSTIRILLGMSAFLGNHRRAHQPDEPKLLQHTTLKAIHWANVTHQQITLTTIQ